MQKTKSKKAKAMKNKISLTIWKIIIILLFSSEPF